MQLSEYQRLATRTDQVPTDDDNDIVVPLLGLAGEAGGILSAYKKRLRDGDAYRDFTEELNEELGDVLWYLARIATRFDLTLDAIAARNLEKTKGRWLPTTIDFPVFDAGFPEGERFPRILTCELQDTVGPDGRPQSQLKINGAVVGDSLEDHAYDDDGFRFHDVIHLAEVAVLGWSPAMRALMNLKRRSNQEVARIEDGGRARLTDEGIASLVFENARRHDLFEGISHVDGRMLETIMGLTSHLEVRLLAPGDWERTILMAFGVWRRVVEAGRVRFIADLDTHDLRIT